MSSVNHFLFFVQLHMNSPLLLELLLLRDESLLEEEWDEDEEDEEEEDELTDEDLLRLRFRFFSSLPINQFHIGRKTRQTIFNQNLSNQIWSCYTRLHYNTRTDLLSSSVKLEHTCCLLWPLNGVILAASCCVTVPAVLSLYERTVLLDFCCGSDLFPRSIFGHGLLFSLTISLWWCSLYSCSCFLLPLNSLCVWTLLVYTRHTHAHSQWHLQAI